MIKGTGVDIVEISRIEKAINRRDGFLRRVYTVRELEDCMAEKPRTSSLAARFAAKEAVSKALGTGIGKVKWTDIEIINQSTGKPEVFLRGGARDIMLELGIATIELSMSHSREYAVAFAIAY
ncbi:MAG TPA: holo-ACP synthase [Desulfobacteria bacterium]|nr:holo-ACP synthase [Desulfobacteria bacterium]